MDISYDEDLSQNPFFVELQNEHNEILDQCITNGWILCIPRAGTLVTHIFTLQDFLGHVLVSNEELPDTHFLTLTERQVRVVNKVISIDQNNAGLPLEIHILFEETFYTEQNMKYIVWCIESPLEPAFRPVYSGVSRYSCLLTLHDCIDFLWTESCGKEVLENMDSTITSFKGQFIKQQSMSLNKLKDLVSSLYTKCLQMAFKNKKLKDRSRHCKNTMNNVKLAVETYVLHGVYKEVFKVIGNCTAYEDSILNKIIRNHTDIQLIDLDVKHDFDQSIPIAKKHLSRVQYFSTILGKVGCIRNTVVSIKKFSSNEHFDANFVTTDELLPVLIFLVIKSGLPNWLTHLNFMKNFRFSVHSNFQSDEVSFYISTMEAVIEQIKIKILPGSPALEYHFVLNDDKEDNFELIHQEEKLDKAEFRNGLESTEVDSLQYLFEQIKLSNFDKVHQILIKFNSQSSERLSINDINSDADKYLDFDLRKSVSIEEVLNEDNLEKPLELCHPLCTCSKCCRLISKTLMRTTPTVFSCDEHGFTALHIACIYGKPHIVEIILEMGADIHASDYNGSTPLHYAAARGHQNALLLLLHAGANVNKKNMDKNTALHMASNNGHDCCVKAILYFNECKTNLDINAISDSGDTPIHLASKWGYESIARLLLEQGADPWIKNSKAKTAVDIAHSGLMAKLLLSGSPNFNEYVNIINVNPNEPVAVDFDNVESDIDYLDLSDVISETSSIYCDGNSNSKPESFFIDKPISMESIRQVERLFRAISYGDLKLACFYMNVDLSPAVQPILDENTNSVSANETLCHPLCTCHKCKGTAQLEPSLSCGSFDFNMRDSEGNTALHIAVRYGRRDIFEIVLKNGANVDIQNKNGLTPLHIAAQEGKYIFANMLIEKSINLDLQDCMGNNPLHLACVSGNVEIVNLILNKTSYCDTSNSLGRTPLDEAKDRMFLTIINLLENELKNKND